MVDGVVGAATSTLASIATGGTTVLIAVLGIFAGLVVLGLAFRWISRKIAKKA